MDAASLPRAEEAVEALRRHAPQTRVWAFQPPVAGSAGSGSLEPLEGPLRVTPGSSSAAPAALSGGTGAAARSSGGRLSSAELSMLLGPTRTLRSPAGDAG